MAHCHFSPGRISPRQSRNALSVYRREVRVSNSFLIPATYPLPRASTSWRNVTPVSIIAAPQHQKRSSFPASSAPGDLVLIHGTVLHKSRRNTSARTRFAYTFHMIESPPHAVYDEKNWLQPTEAMPFSRILDTPNPTVLKEVV